MLGWAAKVDINKESCTIVGDGSTQSNGFLFVSLSTVFASDLLACPSHDTFGVLQVGEEVLGRAAKVDINKESCTIAGDGSTHVIVNNFLWISICLHIT